MNNDDRIIVRVECAIPEFAECWIEYDVTAWGPLEFRTIPDTPVWSMQKVWLETHSVDWHIPRKDGKGTVAHPGQTADEKLWLECYDQMPESLLLAQWVNFTPLTALSLSMSASKKR